MIFASFDILPLPGRERGSRGDQAANQNGSGDKLHGPLLIIIILIRSQNVASKLLRFHSFVRRRCVLHEANDYAFRSGRSTEFPWVTVSAGNYLLAPNCPTAYTHCGFQPPVFSTPVSSGSGLGWDLR